MNCREFLQLYYIGIFLLLEPNLKEESICKTPGILFCEHLYMDLLDFAWIYIDFACIYMDLN